MLYYLQYSFLKDFIYSFMRDIHRERKREREREAETQAEGEADSMQEPDAVLDPGTSGSRPGLKVALNR